MRQQQKKDSREMEKYIIVRGKAFESVDKFQKRVNEQAAKGYKAINVAGQIGTVVLMEKLSH
jgi:hypothetical protein